MTITTAIKRVNLGCGKYPLVGYLNVDAHEPADYTCDIWDCAFVDLDEVRMDHFLEHLPWTETHELLERVHSWLRPGGKVVVEVPDIETIMEQGTNGDWLRYLYGSQQHEGEFHRSGFSLVSLFGALEDAGFSRVSVERFFSTFRTRPGMPCLKAEGYA